MAHFSLFDLRIIHFLLQRCTYSILKSSVSICDTSMSVTLDNIQFYDGPSKPSKPPHSAFNSRRYCTGVFPSSERPIFTQTTGCPLTSRSTASHENNQKHQQTAVLPNVFDIELRKSLGGDLLPLAKDAALEGASCDSLPIFDLGHQEDFNRDLSLDRRYQL